MDFFNSFFAPAAINVATRFTLLKEAISGTMSKFHMATDKQSGKTVGLKLLDLEKTAQFEARFTGLAKPPEGEIAMKLKHPLLVETLEHGKTTDGRQYIVMEYVEGPGLNSLIVAREPKLAGKRVPLVRQMAEAIEYVHAQGYIHRDICPRNFIAKPDLSGVKLIDFGLTVPATEKFMGEGNRTGTPNYMAPEIVRRRPTDQRVDIFAFGVTAYQLLTFDLPWPTEDTTGKAAMAHDQKPPVPITQHRPNLNPQLAEAIMSCIARDPAGRPQTMSLFLRAIRQVQKEEV